MFTVIYSFQVKPGQVHKFEKAWKDLTLLISEYEGSLGSRLHKQSELSYIAYAQ
jgi:heme-degrading monooxygenase HmoA